MPSFSLSAGARALGLLSLSSALLAGCGGGGGGDDSVPAPVVSNAVEITTASQLAVAADAGTIFTSLSPMASLGAMFTLVPPTVADGVQTQTAAVKTANPAAILGAAARKFAPAAGGARLALGVATTYPVACSTGSGTATEVESETGANSYSASINVELHACQTTLGDQLVTMDGTLKVNVSMNENETGLYEIVATNYVAQGEGFLARIDGNMRISGNAGTTVTSGTRLSYTTTIPTGEPLATAAQAATTQRTVTLRDYNETIVASGTGTSTTVQAKVETNAFGDVASYELTTPAALVRSGDLFSSQSFTSGQLKVVGRNGAILLISANGDGTFKLERDDNGDGSIQETVTPVTAQDLNLSFGLVLQPL
jgi:hypothetical protein